MGEGNWGILPWAPLCKGPLARDLIATSSTHTIKQSYSSVNLLHRVKDTRSFNLIKRLNRVRILHQDRDNTAVRQNIQL